jgi:hypothetical protein
MEVDSFMLQLLYVRKISPLDIIGRKMVSLRDGLHEAAKAKFQALPSIEPCSTSS